MCNRDILGGYFTTMEEQIAETSDYIIRLTNGQDVSQLPIKESLKKCVVDWLVLNRWGIPVSKVPKHIEILNMPFLCEISDRSDSVLQFAVCVHYHNNWLSDIPYIVVRPNANIRHNWICGKKKRISVIGSWRWKYIWLEI